MLPVSNWVLVLAIGNTFTLATLSNPVNPVKKDSPLLHLYTAKISTNYHLPTTNYLSHKHERNTYMKLEIDWLEMAKAVAKAIWPFIAGAFGGLFSGCTFGGIGPNFI